MTNEHEDQLPDGLVAALRAVPTPDPQVREAHISAALAAFDDAGDAGRGSITSLAPRRRAVLGIAAALLVALGAGAGYAARGDGGTVRTVTELPEAAAVTTVSPSTLQGAETTVPAVKNGSVEVPGSPVRPNSGLPCTAESDGALYVGQYLRDGVLHLVFVSAFTIEVVRADTCETIVAYQQPADVTP
jgi:hypothetical protein